MDNDKTGVELDLDALSPKSVKINYKEKVIEIQPLNLELFSKLYDLASEVSKIDKINQDDPQRVIDIYTRVEKIVKEAIPELVEESLNSIQLTALFELLVKINTPQDKAIDELNKRGITINKGSDSDPKDLTSQEQ